MADASVRELHPAKPDPRTLLVLLITTALSEHRLPWDYQQELICADVHGERWLISVEPLSEASDG